MSGTALSPAIERPPAEGTEAAFSAAAALEDAGDHAVAFAQFVRANALCRARFPYDGKADEALFEALRRTFARDLPLLPDSTITEAPVFVVGLPRTGISLVHRLLSAHSQLWSAGDLPAMPAAVRQITGDMARPVLDTQTIAGLAGRSAQALGELYITRMRQQSKAQGLRPVDKFSANFLYIGWIVEALPNASIVCLRRGAMDSVWSNFRTPSAAGSTDYPWSHDLLDAARYVLMFQRLMAFWRQRFPGRIHEISFEHLVTDQEVQTRRMLAHCGLPWDPACHDICDREAKVASGPRRPSRPPSIGRWHAHEAALADVMEFFLANGIPLD